MATVHIKFNSSAETTLSYVLGHGRENSMTSNLMAPGGKEEIAQSFALVRETHNSQRGNGVAHIRQSFTPEESKKFSVALLNELGEKMVQTHFPGHQYVCVTHTDTPHYHNHIVINTVNIETGKRIHNQFSHFHELKKVNDRLCLEHGLTVPNKNARLREVKMPDKVQRMTRFGRFSQLMEMKQKADFARSYATGYDEYRGILGELGIHVRIEKENISYFYPGAKFAKRGKNLGRQYDKEGLEKTFQANDERFENHWDVRQKVRNQIDAYNDSKSADLRHTKRDYSQYMVIPRRQDHLMTVPDHVLESCMVPIDEIRKAKRCNIIDYCNANRISLAKTDQGKRVLKDRPYVEVESFGWKNTKNNTEGSLIDLVAYHKNVSYLEAVSHINNNPRLLLLEEYFGKQKPVYRSFYVPKSDRMLDAEAKGKFAKLADFYSFHPDTAKHFYHKGQVQIFKEGVVRIFDDKSHTGAFEFKENEKGEWSHEKVGHFKSALFKCDRKTSALQIFPDFFSFMRQDQTNLFTSGKGISTIALFEPNQFQLIDLFLA